TRNIGRYARRGAIAALAGVVLCFQLMLAMHPYSHTLSHQEAACEACLVGSHSAPPAKVMTPPRLVAPASHEPTSLVPLPVVDAPVVAHRPRAPPLTVLPA